MNHLADSFFFLPNNRDAVLDSGHVKDIFSKKMEAERPTKSIATSASVSVRV